METFNVEFEELHIVKDEEVSDERITQAVEEYFDENPITVDIPDCDMLIKTDFDFEFSSFDNLQEYQFYVTRGNASDIVNKIKNNESVKVCLLSSLGVGEIISDYIIHYAKRVRITVDNYNNKVMDVVAQFVGENADIHGNTVLNLYVDVETNEIRVSRTVVKYPTLPKGNGTKGQIATSDSFGGIVWKDDNASNVIAEYKKQDSIPRTILPYNGYKLETTTEDTATAPSYGNLANLYSKWDELVREYPNNVSMEVLGMDATNTYEIRCYTITSNSDKFKWTLSNPQSNLKIIWLSGIHGHESTIFVDDLKFFTELLKQDNEVTVTLMDNCSFKVIPVISPWGYENSSRINGNGVNLNRNFNSNWKLSGEGTVNYSGASAMSEAETQIIAQFLEDNKDCYMAINRHSSSEFAPTSVLGYFVSQLEVDRKLAYNMARFMSNQIKRSSMYKDYIRGCDILYDLSDVTWEVGAINQSGGNLNNNYRLRTVSTIEIPKGVTISCGESYKMSVALYDSDSKFISKTDFSTEEYITTKDGYYRIVLTGVEDTKFAENEEIINTASSTVKAIKKTNDVETRCLHSVEESTTTGTLDKYFNSLGIHGYLYEASPSNKSGNDYYTEDFGREVWQCINVTNIGNLLYSLMLQNEYVTNE